MTTATDTEKPKIPELPPNWDRCHAYMETKRRYCRQQRRGTYMYCGNHSHLLHASNDSNSNGGNDSNGDSQTKERKRIPCPVDQSHMIWEDQVAKHIPICPKTKKRKREEAQNYFQKDINNGGFGDICTAITTKDHDKAEDEMEWAKQLALRILEVHQKLFSTEANATTNTPQDLTFEEVHNCIEMRDYSAQELSAGIADGFQAHRIRSGGARHIPQLASLIGHLRAIGVLPSAPSDIKATTEKPLLLIDMGAGRGMLGLAAAGVSRSHGLETHLMMVERAGTRSKAEKILRNLGGDKHGSTSSASSGSYLSFDNVQWSRIKCDLSHVNLKVLLEKPELKDCKVVIIAKHLCGVGSDLALKAVEPVKERVDACIFATCCHGVCNWCGYVGRDYLRRHMDTEKTSFGPKEFDLLRQWCAGSVAIQPRISEDGQNNGGAEAEDDADEGEAEHSLPTESTRPSRSNISAVVESLDLKCGIAGLGRACQRLIDYGRLQYLRHNLFDGIDVANVRIFHYVPPQTTPQNALLVATRMKAVQ
ncbi:unnamed protein product [Cylindrotheca closterium]|uniref:tRNA:m(4)X modification enzyme TRM13 n=1 Tax=Cylindrotheca closterium TaxID=2856 RepID=A0AAD2G9M4_9STRA|nr:unnamed protein product [Cylindrotheca closterium]